jgi:hypothetical protein
MKNDSGVVVSAPKLSFVFEGCSWGCIYYLGVYKAILGRYSTEELRVAQFGGSSSGTLAALGAALGKTVEECTEMYTELSHCGELFGVFGLMSVFHEIVLRRWLPKDGKEHLVLNGRLFVNVTRFVAVSDVLSDWTSNDDIIDAMHASMHIPFYMSYCKNVRGAMGLDGGLSANIFHIDDDTFTVSAATRKGDIHPRVLVSAAECFAPPSTERKEAIFLEGASAVFPIASDAESRIQRAESRRTRSASQSLVKKGMTQLLRYSLCTIFWTARVLEVRPWTYASIAGLATALYLYPRQVWALAHQCFPRGSRGIGFVCTRCTK